MLLKKSPIVEFTFFTIVYVVSNWRIFSYLTQSLTTNGRNGSVSIVVSEGF